MTWSDSVIWWQVFPLGFAGAPDEALPGGHTGQDVASGLPTTGWLDHLIELGCNGLALGPVFAAQSHGYDTVDHLRIDSRLGTASDLRQLLDDSHARGIRVLLDGVFNHVGSGHPEFTRALQDGPGSDAAALFRWRDVAAGVPEVFEGHQRLVTLNHDHPAVADLVVAIMDHWLAFGVDGWRLDAAYAVPAAFWRQVLPRVRAAHPDAWFVGEIIHGDYADYVQQSTLDSITQYELWKAIWSSLKDRNFFELAWSLQRHAELIRSFVPLTFLGNHDVTRIASQLGDRRMIPHAAALLCCLPGIPSVYYGDEYGLEAVKEERLGGDDAIRPAFPAEPGLMSEWFPDADPDVEDVYRTMIGLRRRHPWLSGADIEVAALANEQLGLVMSEHGGPGRLSLLLNVSEQDHEFELPGSWTVLERSAPGAADPARQPSSVTGYGWVVLTPA